MGGGGDSGGGSVPAGTQSTPGYAWITVASTVGAEVTSCVASFNPGIARCEVDSSIWSDPSKPSLVNVFTVSVGHALQCYRWWAAGRPLFVAHPVDGLVKSTSGARRWHLLP